MKKHDLLWTLMVLPAFITGCSDDLDITSTPAVAGDEIVFGAKASYENGDVQTRTEYGAKGDGYQIINWVVGDMVRIECAQATNVQSADYTVTSVEEGSTAEGEDTESTAVTLEKVDEGLQWGTDVHTFYAVYPSPDHFDNPTTEQEQTTLSGSTVTGVIPVTQTPKSVEKNVTVDDETYDYVFEPNMDYAYMAARAVYDPASEGAEGVELHFKPLVTAIEVNLNIGEIDLNTDNKQLTLNSVSLHTTGSQNLSGSFSANISNLNTNEETISGADITDTSTSSTTHNEVTLNFYSSDLSDRVVLGPEGKCLFTFFINPCAEFDSENNEELKLLVNYTCNGVNSIKSYTIGRDIAAHKKYFFKNITLPDITSETNVSSWFASLDDNVLITQLSIPGAGNAASYNYSGGTNSGWYKEQTISLTDQWNAGVRCFELVSDRASSSTGNLWNVNLQCNSTSVGITFGQAVDLLTNLLKANPNECLIIICNYQPSSQSRDCQIYMDNFANTFTGDSYEGISFVKLSATSTVGDIRGKLAFIGRISQEGEDDSTSLSNVPSWFTYIEGWGSLKDKWNRRYGDSYYPGYNLRGDLTGTRSNVEDLLFGTSRNYTASYPTPSVNFSYDISDNGGTAWVQEWMRVVPQSSVGVYSVGTYSYGSGWNTTRGTLYFYWPESYSEKLDNITTTFERSKGERDSGNTLFINSLCGYYVDSRLTTSYVPYVDGSVTININNRTTATGTLSTTGGYGGNFGDYSEDINSDVYSYLTSATASNTTGPLGIVMMDYIGSTDAGTYLPSIIINNNFSFSLRTK